MHLIGGTGLSSSGLLFGVLRRSCDRRWLFADGSGSARARGGSLMTSLMMSRLRAGLMRTDVSSKFRLGPQRPSVRSRSSSAKASISSDLRYFLQQPNVVVVDVRTPQEYYEARINEAKLIPVQEIPERLDDFPTDVETPIVLFCRVGQRSGLAKNFLEQVGYSNVFNGVTLETVANAMEAEIVSGDPARA